MVFKCRLDIDSHYLYYFLHIPIHLVPICDSKSTELHFKKLTYKHHITSTDNQINILYVGPPSVQMSQPHQRSPQTPRPRSTRNLESWPTQIPAPGTQHPISHIEIHSLTIWHTCLSSYSTPKKVTGRRCEAIAQYL